MTNFTLFLWQVYFYLMIIADIKHDKIYYWIAAGVAILNLSGILERNKNKDDKKV